MLHFEVAASDGKFSCAQEFYLNPKEIAEVGRRLRKFPTSIHDEVILKFGEKNDSVAYAVYLRFWIYNAFGHAAVNIDLSNKAHDPNGQCVHFTIRCKIASLNLLDSSLCTWIEGNEPLVLYELSPAGT